MTRDVNPTDIYWHRDLPPRNAEPIGEHVLEATSERVPGRLTHRDEQWSACYESLMAKARERLSQEVIRLGGNCAHVLREAIEERHDDVLGEAWLYGRFEYVLFRNDPASDAPPASLPPQSNL